MRRVATLWKGSTVVIVICLAAPIVFYFSPSSFDADASSRQAGSEGTHLEDGNGKEEPLHGNSRMERHRVGKKTTGSLSKQEYLQLVKMSHADTSHDAAIRSFQAGRKAHLKAFCQKSGERKTWKTLQPIQRRNLLRHLLVSDKYKFLYCYTPKVACANWKKILKVLDEKAIHPNDGLLNHMKDVKFLADYPAEEIEQRLRTYYKFTFVREPISRLVSAFINKFREIKDFQLRHGVEIIRKYRAHPPRFSRGEDVTFDEFVRSLIDESPERYNEHWMSVENLCQPCVVDYDFIGAYENLEAESNFAIRQVNGSGRVAFPAPQSYYKPASSTKVQDMYLSLPEQHRRRLVALFENDFRMFNYPFPSLDTD